MLTPGGIPKADEIGTCGALTPWKWWKEVFAIFPDSKQLLQRLFYHSAYKKKDKYSIDFTFELVSGGYYIHREVGRECIKSGVSRSDREGWNLWKMYLPPFYTSQIIARLIPPALLKTTSNVSGWQVFLMHHFPNFLKNSWKIGTPFGRWYWKIGTLFDTLARQVEKLARLMQRWHPQLKNWHAFGTLARLLARWHLKIRSCHAFGTLARTCARRPRWHAWYARHVIYQTLVFLLWIITILYKYNIYSIRHLSLLESSQ